MKPNRIVLREGGKLDGKVILRIGKSTSTHHVLVVFDDGSASLLVEENHEIFRATLEETDEVAWHPVKQ